MSRERKLPKLRGRPRDSQGADVTDWLEDISAGLNARHMSPDEQVDFVMQHLVGEQSLRCDYDFVVSKTNSTTGRRRGVLWPHRLSN